MKSACTSIDERALHLRPVLYSSIYIYTCPHAPGDLYVTPMNPPALEHWESCALPSAEADGICPSPAASINPSKTDAASAVASPPGNPRGSDGPIENACETASGTRGFRTASMYEATLGTSMLGEILGPMTSRTDKDLRRRHRSRLLETTSTLGEVLGDGRHLSQCALKGTRLQYFNIGKAADPWREGALARKSVLEEPNFAQANFPFLSRAEARSEFDPSSFSIVHPPSYHLFRNIC